VSELPKHLRITGTTYYREDVLRLLDGETSTLKTVQLKPDPKNEHDPYAVKVLNIIGRQLGWVARTDHWAVHAALDMAELHPPAGVGSRILMGHLEAEAEFNVRLDPDDRPIVVGRILLHSMHPIWIWK
jgi:hypothetical protein